MAAPARPGLREGVGLKSGLRGLELGLGFRVKRVRVGVKFRARDAPLQKKRVEESTPGRANPVITHYRNGAGPGVGTCVIYK